MRRLVLTITVALITTFGSIAPVSTNASAPGSLRLGWVGGVGYDRTSDSIYVADEIGHRILKLSRQGQLRAVWKGIALDSCCTTGGPTDIGVDAKGNVYAEEPSPGLHRVQKFSPSGKSLATWPRVLPKGVASMAVDTGGNVYLGGDTVVSQRSKTVVKLSPIGGKLWTIHLPQLAEAIALDGRGTLYVSTSSGSGSGSAIVTFSPAGKQMSHIAVKTRAGAAMAIDALGNVYLADDVTQSVIKLSHIGTVLGRWPITAVLTGVTVDAHGNIYVGSFLMVRGGAVTKFSSSGRVLATWK